MTATRASAADSAARRPDADEHPYRMKDLCERTGLARQVIHFYIQQGLVPEGRKTGRNMAYYGERHVERIRLIRKLQHERFLPLRAIRAMLDEREEAFTAAQRRLLLEVQRHLPGALASRDGAASATVDADALLARAGLAREDLDQMVELGLLGARTDEHGRTLVARDDAWMLELWGEVRALGFSRELGFTVADLRVYDDAVDALFKREAEMLTARLAHLPPPRVAAMVARALPLIDTFLARYHATKVRNFFAAMQP